MRHMAVVIWFGLAVAMLVGAVQFSDRGRFGEGADHIVRRGWTDSAGSSGNAPLCRFGLPSEGHRR